MVCGSGHSLFLVFPCLPLLFQATAVKGGIATYSDICGRIEVESEVSWEWITSFCTGGMEWSCVQPTAGMEAKVRISLKYIIVEIILNYSVGLREMAWGEGHVKKDVPSSGCFDSRSFVCSIKRATKMFKGWRQQTSDIMDAAWEKD